MSKTLIHVESEIKDSIKAYIGDMSYDNFLSGILTLMDAGMVEVTSDGIICHGGKQYMVHPELEKFQDACEGASLDLEYGLAKATLAVKRGGL